MTYFLQLIVQTSSRQFALRTNISGPSPTPSRPLFNGISTSEPKSGGQLIRTLKPSSRHPPHIGTEDYVNDAEGRMTAAQRSHLHYHSPTKQPGKAATPNFLQPEDQICKIYFLSQTAHLTDRSQTYYEIIIL